MVYYKTDRIYRQDGDPQWNKGTISKMLTNRAYTGTLVQGVKQQNLAKGMKQQFVDESQYIVYENAHEPIISKEDFEKVLQGRADRLKNNAFGAEMHNFERDYENRYKGLIFNNATGKELYRRTRIYGINHDRLYYSFQNDTFTGKIDNEVRVFIMERDLDKAMSEKVAEFIIKATSKAKLIERVSTRFSESIGKLNEDISKLKIKTQKEELLIQKAYEEYSLGKIDREEYSLKRKISLSYIATINNEVISVEKVVKDLERDKKIAIKWIKDIFSAKKVEKLPADLIHSLVEKIIVYGNHNFEIIFKFNMDSLMGGVEDE